MRTEMPSYKKIASSLRVFSREWVPQTINNTEMSISQISYSYSTIFKYLGIVLFKNGSWNRTKKYLADHSRFALHNLFIVFN